MHLNSDSIAAIFSKENMSDKKAKHSRDIGQKNPNKLSKADKKRMAGILRDQKSDDIDKLWDGITKMEEILRSSGVEFKSQQHQTPFRHMEEDGAEYDGEETDDYNLEDAQNRFNNIRLVYEKYVDESNTESNSERPIAVTDSSSNTLQTNLNSNQTLLGKHLYGKLHKAGGSQTNLDQQSSD